MNDKQENDVNKVWDGFWGREKDQWLKESANLSVLDKELVAKKFFLHKVFHVGYPVVKKYINIQPGQKILEVGTGSGRYGLKLALDFPQSKVVMTDVVLNSLNYVRQVAEKLKLSNVEILQADGLNLFFADNSFDLVICDAVIQYIPAYEQAVREMVRVLKPGGRIIISTVNWWNLPHTMYKWWVGDKYPHGWEKSFSHRELSNLLTDNKVKITAWDGYYFAYGVYRLGYIWKPLKFIARIFDKITKIVDRFIDRAINRFLGFQLIVVGEKEI